jgi:DNA-binding CsgD family transcriptional regulator
VIDNTLASASQRGAVVVVEGPPGIGKTRILDWALSTARTQGFRTLSARGDELERAYPFGMLRQLLNPVLSVPATAAELFAGSGAAAERSLTQASVDPTDDSADPGYATLSGLYSLFVNLSGQGRLLAVIDDGHWADEASLRFVNFLAMRIAQLPLVVLLGSRPRDPGGISELLVALSSDPETRRVRLRPLSESASTALVRARLGIDATAVFCAACHEVTSGNPFFLGALIDELQSRGIEPTTAGARDVLTIEPEAVISALLVRVARLGPQARALARAIAVLGGRADLRVAEQLSGVEHADALRAVDALIGADILRRSLPLEFVHPIVRSAIYGDLPVAARSDAHLRAARVLNAEHAESWTIAGHLLETDPVGEPWVAEVIRRAARDASRRAAPESAATYLQRALREPLTQDQRADVLLDLAVSEPPTSEESVERAREALAVTKFAGLSAAAKRARAARTLSHRLLGQDRPGDAREILEEVIGELDRTTQRDIWLGLEADLAAFTVFDAGQSSDMGERLDRLEPELSGSTSAELHLLAMLAYRKTQTTATAGEAAELAMRALSGGLLLDEGIDGSTALFAAGFALDMAGRFEQADSLYDDMITQGPFKGLGSALPAAYCFRAAERFRSGALDDALEDVQIALEGCEILQWDLVTINAVAYLLMLLIELGSVSQAGRELRDRELLGQLPNTTTATRLLLARGHVRLAQRQLPAALGDLLEVGRRDVSWGGRSIVFEWRTPAALAYDALGERASALKLAREDLEDARAWEEPRKLGAALHTLGIIEGKASGLNHLREALEVLETSPARLAHARALVDLGAALRRAGDAAQARDLLQDGSRLARSCGARALAVRAERELAATGVRPLRRARSGPESLTPTERRVCDLAVTGLSNPEIGEALFVTRKTVEMHLSNAYRKLGINSRNDLAKVLARSK